MTENGQQCICKFPHEGARRIPSPRFCEVCGGSVPDGYSILDGLSVAQWKPKSPIRDSMTEKMEQTLRQVCDKCGERMYPEDAEFVPICGCLPEKNDKKPLTINQRLAQLCGKRSKEIGKSMHGIPENYVVLRSVAKELLRQLDQAESRAYTAGRNAGIEEAAKHYEDAAKGYQYAGMIGRERDSLSIANYLRSLMEKQ